MTRQQTAINHSKSYEALKKIVQEFAINSTTCQEAMQIGRVEAGATAPTTAWPPSVAETSEGSWGRIWCYQCHGFTVLDPQRRRSRTPGPSPMARARAKGKDNFGKGKDADEWDKSNYDGDTNSTHGMYKVERLTFRPLSVTTRSTRSKKRTLCHIALSPQHIALICYTLTRGSSCAFHKTVIPSCFAPCLTTYTQHFVFSFIRLWLLLRSPAQAQG